MDGPVPLVSGLDGSALVLSCRQLGNDVTVIAVAGELDMATAPQLRAYLTDKTAARPNHIVLNLSRVTFLASHGIAVLIDAHEGREGIHGAMHLTGVTASPSVMRVLHIAGLIQWFDVHDDESELLRRLAHA